MFSLLSLLEEPHAASISTTATTKQFSNLIPLTYLPDRHHQLHLNLELDQSVFD
jgi:hypothetical protein